MEKGYIHIYTGDGKGKTTAATGLAVRCAGSGGKVLWFQFLKKDTSGERKSLEVLNGVELLPGYENIKFSFRMTEEEKEQARSFYEDRMAYIVKQVNTKEYDLLILDEAIGAVNTGMLGEESLVKFLEKKPEGLEVVLTGRDPSEKLLELADYVSNIQKVKHPFEQGVKARKMIEW